MESVTIPITVTKNLAQFLSYMTAPTKDRSDRDAQTRFEWLEDIEIEPPLLDPKFDAGSLHWCMSMSDALILQGYEHASGYETLLLWDLEGTSDRDEMSMANYVVATTRTYGDQ